MTAHLKLRVHITEPWDFERQTGMEDLTGWTVDYVIDELEEWEVMLDASYRLHDVVHGRILVSPRYVGERLGKIFDTIVGTPVRIAHRLDGDWHYAMAGTLSLRHDEKPKESN
ncbi:hypothetical protein GCM10007897_32320 [Sphingobium jiangsuense]|uniref:Uncharacterized protein n=1 Tax=Sphingobium jiangsuense TaxID=870476 RepID=A0A7W6BKN6_9SPHN|nr:hypothetical protein [Sphingobium jiangsuense]MBB3925357.1 hypothetical protein [Sphingobium jiangsuense]GLT01832.1 hypothetical protein GCM10007897_32320 [Sphingobium jiangsuense]